jgi:hypothetical protein
VGGSASQIGRGLGPTPSRVYETSAGVLHAIFGPSSLLLAKVATDGWMPVFEQRSKVARSASALFGALQRHGVSGEEAEQLTDRMLDDWQAIEIPPPRSRREVMTHRLQAVLLLLRLLPRAPRFAWELIRPRKHVGDTGERQPWMVRPGSPEYGVIRLLRTSIGWAEFEFWGGPQARLGLYQEDGWLPLRRQRFRVDQPDLIDVLRADGLPDEEAERVGNLVLAEREARTARDC